MIEYLSDIKLGVLLLLESGWLTLHLESFDFPPCKPFLPATGLSSRRPGSSLPLYRYKEPVLEDFNVDAVNCGTAFALAVTWRVERVT